MGFCTSCGNTLVEGARFCAGCGQTLTVVEPHPGIQRSGDMYQPTIMGAPSLAVPIIFGLLGAWWASNKATRLGVTDTGRYWKAAVISTAVSFAVTLIVPIAIFVVLGLALGSSGAAIAEAPISRNIAPTAPSGIDPTAPSRADTPAPTGGPTATPIDQTKVAALMNKVSANPQDTVQLQALGDLYFAGADYKNAVVWEQKVLDIDPKNEVALLAVGAAQFNLGNPAAAEKQWLIAAALYPRSAEVHYDLGFLYMSATPPAKAKMNAEWKKVVAIDPSSNLAKTVASHLSKETGDPRPK